MNAYNDTSLGHVLLISIPKALMGVICLLLYNKTIDVIITLLSERDFFKSGHLQFVHNLKEGVLIVHDRLKSIKLINVAAR